MAESVTSEAQESAESLCYLLSLRSTLENMARTIPSLQLILWAIEDVVAEIKKI